MTPACEQPAKHFTSTLPTDVSLMDSEGVVSSCAGQHAIQPIPLRHQIEVDLAYSTDPFERAQAMRLTEVLCRELQNLGDLAAAGSVPWDSGTPDAATLQAACKSARDYLAGYSDSARRMMGGSPAAASNGAGAAGDRAPVSDADAAGDAHRRMVADIGNAWRRP